MIKTTRSRIEIRQEPDHKSSLLGALLTAVGGLGALLALASLITEWALPVGRGYAISGAKLAASLALLGLGWFLLRRRSRIVLDLDHRMVARYRSFGSPSVGGNLSWDLAEFSAVILVDRERRRFLKGLRARSAVVCLRRPDGTDLELYWSADPQEGAETAARVANFTGLPYFGRRA
jgi:hypothetical protein